MMEDRPLKILQMEVTAVFLSWFETRIWITVFSFSKGKVYFQNLIYYSMWCSFPFLWNVCGLYFPLVTGGMFCRGFLYYHLLLISLFCRISGYLRSFHRSSLRSHEFRSSTIPCFPLSLSSQGIDVERANWWSEEKDGVGGKFRDLKLWNCSYSSHVPNCLILT